MLPTAADILWTSTAAAYQKNNAQTFITIEMEEAMRLLERERIAG